MTTHRLASIAVPKSEQQRSKRQRRQASVMQPSKGRCKATKTGTARNRTTGMEHLATARRQLKSANVELTRQVREVLGHVRRQHHARDRVAVRSGEERRRRRVVQNRHEARENAGERGVSIQARDGKPSMQRESERGKRSNAMETPLSARVKDEQTAMLQSPSGGSPASLAHLLVHSMENVVPGLLQMRRENNGVGG
jgi:hypothetical protein